jgi:hypothetical protein
MKSSSHSSPGARDAGMVLVLALAFTGLLILLASGLSRTSRGQIEIRRDEAEALRAEMASEAGLEYARRQLLLDAAWAGTGADAVQIGNGGGFQVAVKSVETADGGAADVSMTVTGLFGQAVHRFTSVVRLLPGTVDAYTYALLVLGEEFRISDSLVNGDVMLADEAYRINDWKFDLLGNGYYLDSGGPDDGGSKVFDSTGVNGTVFKYRDDLPDYQDLGEEKLLADNTFMPSWNLDEFLVPGPGKVILTNPHNLGLQNWRMNNLRYEETVVVVLTNNQTLELTNCSFNGGLVIYCPETHDVRSGSRNLVYVKKGTSIGGGAGGVAARVGLVAPGARLKGDEARTAMIGFSMVNEVDVLRSSDITGQFVILNGARSIDDTIIQHDPQVTSDLPPWFQYGSPSSTTQVVSVYEDFD